MAIIRNPQINRMHIIFLVGLFTQSGAFFISCSLPIYLSSSSANFRLSVSLSPPFFFRIIFHPLAPWAYFTVNRTLKQNKTQNITSLTLMHFSGLYSNYYTQHIVNIYLMKYERINSNNNSINKKKENWVGKMCYIGIIWSGCKTVRRILNDSVRKDTQRGHK